MRKYPLVGLLFSWSLTSFALAGKPEPGSVTVEEAQSIAEDAYVYFYPLVTMDITRKVMTNGDADAGMGRGPMNTFHHLRTFPSADIKDVVRPNFDTLYSLAWLDLSKGPVIVSNPDTQGRYYLLPMLDMWTDVFSVPGKRTTGTKPANYAITPILWQGNLPPGVERIDAPTNYVWILGRTQTNTAKDYSFVKSIQDGYKVTPLEQWGKESLQPEPVFDPTVDMKTPPLDQVNGMPALDYFRYAVELLKVNPPHITDNPILERMKRIGIVRGQSLTVTNPAIEKALIQGAAAGLQKMQTNASKVGTIINGWQILRDQIGVYGNSYFKRAIIAMVGLGANLPEDAIYPLTVADADGQPLHGDHQYVLHFNKDELPPVNAFWSVTMYDAAGFVVNNPINRFALGDRDPLQYNPDGSLDIYIQNERPDPKRESNWLPAPLGPLSITMRLYAPKETALSGLWNPPAVRRVN